MKECTCKQIIKNAPKLPRALKGTYESSNMIIGLTSKKYKNSKKRDPKYMKVYGKSYYKEHQQELIEYARRWRKLHGKGYYQVNKAQIQARTCRWLLKSKRATK